MQRNYIDLRRKICCFNCVTVGIFPSLLWYLSIAVLCLSVVVTFSASLLNQFSFYSRKIPEWCFLILWVLILVYWLTTTVVIIIRRSMSPFRQRCVYLIILSGSANFAIFTYFLIRQAYPSIKIPCHVSHWWNNMSYSMLILPYIVRAWRLHVIFNFKRQSLLEENEVSKISKMISNKRLIILLLILLIPFIILSLSETFIPPLQIVLASEPGCGSPQTVRIFWISVNAGLFFFFSLMIFALRKVWDDFSIKQELMIIALSELFFLLFHSVSLAWPNQEENLNLHFLVCLRCVVYFWMSLSLPLYQSYGFEIIPVLTSPRDAQSFSGVLTNPEFFHFFMSFMSTDPDKPLIEFYIQVELYRSNIDSPNEKRLEDALSIFLKYLDNENKTIDSRAFHELQIVDSELLENIRSYFVNELSSVPLSLFDLVNQKVFSHLENNAFKRFKESSDYQRILDMVSEQETIQDVLRRSRMIQGLDSHSAIGLHRSSWTDVEDDDLPLLTNSDLSISLRGGSPVRSYL